MPTFPIKRAEVKPGEVLCSYCTARCCRYFAVPIDTPTTWDEYDNIRWFLMHGPMSIFVDDDVWYLVVNADCRHLQADNRCGIYETRPGICRTYSTKDCEYDNPFLYEKYFDTPEQIQEYAEAVLPPRRKKRQSSGMMNLPILSGV